MTDAASDENTTGKTVEQLTDPDPRVRLAALETLAGESSVDARLTATLNMLLADGDPRIARLASSILDRLGADHVLDVGSHEKKFRPVLTEASSFQQALESLFWELGDPDSAVREETAQAIAASGGGDIGFALSKALDGDYSAMLHIAQSEDVRVIPPLVHAHFHSAMTSAAECLVQMGDVAVEPLLRWFYHPEVFFRAGIPMLLARIGSDRAIDPLIEQLYREKEQVVKVAVIESLGFFRASDVVETLLECLGSPQAELQAAAVRSLGRQRDPRAVKPILNLLMSAEELVRVAAIAALGELGDEGAVESLLILLHNETGPIVRAAARSIDGITSSSLGSLVAELFAGKSGVAAQIAEMKKPCCLHPLYWTLVEGEPEIRAECARALAVFPPNRTLQHLLDALCDEHRAVGEAARDSLIQIGTIAVEPLIHLVHHPESHVRRNVLEVLGGIGDPAATQAAIGCLKDPHGGVRAASVNALGKFGNADAVAPLTELLKDSNPQIVSEVLQTLGQLKAPQAFDPLVEALESDDPSVRLAAIDGLLALGDPRAVKSLKAVASLLNRKELPTVKDAAKEALRVLQGEDG